MKIALVHDYLREYGGAERVLEVMHELWPGAPLYTAFVDWVAMGEFADRFREWDIRASWVDRNWLVKRYHSPLRFLTPLVWESFNLYDYDVVISSSGWYISRGVVTRPETLHISYIHHPPRNLYGYPTGTQAKPWVKAYASIINPFLRVYDYSTAQRVDVLVANSETTRERIKKFYRRDATVIYPPVEIAPTGISPKRNENYYLSVGRLNFAKRIDLAIAVCNKLQLSLKVVGTGKEEEKLRSVAGPTIEFVGGVSDEQLATLYKGAKAVIFSALEEDFGIVPVESMQAGTPVIALHQGGVTETVIEGKTGVFFDEPNIDSLTVALHKFNSLKFSTTEIVRRGEEFSKAVFKQKLHSFIKKELVKHQKQLASPQVYK